MIEIPYAGGLLIGNRVKAQYRSSADLMHRSNCYIEALPLPLELEEADRCMKRLPHYSETERSLPVLERLNAVQRIANCVIPLPEYIQLEQKFSRMLRNGYFARNPLSVEWVEQMQTAFEDLVWERDGYAHAPLIRSTAAGFAVIGASGVGKTTLVESILSLYPQVIVHTEYNGRPFDQQQLVWIKLDCPYDGSPKGLCTAFFQAVDRVMGTRYAAEYSDKRNTADYLLPVMARVAGQLGLGVLVIDEIQRLKGAGKQSLLTFFVQLTNTMGVPVVLLGTYKAFSLFTEEFAAARRAAGQGDVIINNFATDDFWDYFITSIWRYQWTAIPTPLTPPLNKALYEESQGIADIAVKLYMFAQWQVIGESERITPNLIRVVAKENLHAAKPILDALRHNDMDALSKIADIRPPRNQMDEMLQKAQRRTIVIGKGATLRTEMMAERSDAEAGTLPHELLALQLMTFGFDPEIARKSARAACDRFAMEPDMKLASVEAFRMAKEADDAKQEAATKPSNKPSAPKRKAKVLSLSGDLREIIKNSSKGTPPYEALKEAGVIKSPMEFYTETA